jgi:hypothetical protein
MTVSFRGLNLTLKSRRSMGVRELAFNTGKKKTNQSKKKTSSSREKPGIFCRPTLSCLQIAIGIDKSRASDCHMLTLTINSHELVLQELVRSKACIKLTRSMGHFRFKKIRVKQRCHLNNKQTRYQIAIN